MNDECYKYYFPKVNIEFVLLLSEIVSNDEMAKIASVFSEKPLDYRSGWPDLTVITDGSFHFAEVKTNDKFLESQIRFATEIARPLDFNCQLIHVNPLSATGNNHVADLQSS